MSKPTWRLAIRSWVVALVLVVLPLLHFGYGPKAVVRMTEGTLRVAPASLRAALLAYEKDLRAGVEEGLMARDKDPLEAAEAVADAIPPLAAKQTPFSEIARAYGRLAGLAFQCNDPFRGQENGRLKGLGGDYYGYVERVLPPSRAMKGRRLPGRPTCIFGHIRRPLQRLRDRPVGPEPRGLRCCEPVAPGLGVHEWGLRRDAVPEETVRG